MVNVHGYRSVFFIMAVMGFGWTSAKVLHLEAEKGAGNADSLRLRGSASGGQTVYLKTGDKLDLKFCLRRRSIVAVSNAVYSNDGGSDTVALWIDHTEVGRFVTVTHSNGGAFWNNMLSSKEMGKVVALPRGEHILSLVIESADQYGSELDKVDLTVSDDELIDLEFQCISKCFDDLSFISTPARDDVPPARIEQRSVAILCAEEDNVQIPVYHTTAKKYRLTASLPSYKALASLNNREVDFSGCGTTFSPEIFKIGVNDGLYKEFRNFKSIDGGQTFDVPGPNHDFPGIINFGSGREIEFGLKFQAEGNSRGQVDSQIGSELFIKLTNISPDEEFEIGVKYKGRSNNFSQVQYKTFSDDQMSQSWQIPDYSWIEFFDNFINLSFRKIKGNAIKVDFIQLKKRVETGETIFEIYKDDNVIVEGISIDFWWTSPNTITLTNMYNGQTWNKVDFFRVYLRIPYTSSFGQIFVMYQDGNVRLLPLPPKHLDWIPFGSSVIIGQTDGSLHRPSAQVKNVDLDPSQLEMNITYLDGGTATASLSNGVDTTILDVEKATYTKDPYTVPFATLRSMWVDDGNSDVEKVTTLGSTVVTRHVLGNWEPFYSTSVLFHRTCISRHNTLSPDIRLDMLA